MQKSVAKNGEQMLLLKELFLAVRIIRLHANEVLTIGPSWFASRLKRNIKRASR